MINPGFLTFFDISFIIAMLVISYLSKRLGDALKVAPFYKLLYITAAFVAVASIIDNVLIIDNGKIAFNQSIYDISKTLVFRYITEDVPEDTLFSEDAGMGKNIIVKAMEDESEVDLETLFNAVIKDKEIINSAFKSN